MTILDGKTIAADIRRRVKEEIAALGRSPGLGVVLVGDDTASHTYVRLKEKVCAEVGIRFEKELLPADAAQSQVEAAIRAFNARQDIDAILLQLPLPEGLDEDAAVATMAPEKDVDGFHPENLALLAEGRPRLMPVLVKAVLGLLDATGEALGGKEAVLFANSAVFADPLRAALEWRGARVTVALSEEVDDPTAAVRTADIVVVAVGRPGYLRATDCKDGAVAIDIGANWLPDGSYVGDVDATGSEAKPGWLSPVPGGVGPVTVASLTENVLELARVRA